jgi:transmembrane sensor
LAPGLSNSIDNEALRWVVDATYSQMSPEHRAELEAWLAADPRHRGAYVRARAALQVMEDTAVATPLSPPTPVACASNNDNDVAGFVQEDTPRLRRTWAGRGLVAACAAAVLAVGAWPPASVELLPPPAAEKNMTLADGSVATLRGSGKIDVQLSANIRRITLVSGEALFHVAKDKARPFVVRSGDIYAQATGTIYSVSRVGRTGGTVRVMQGSVLVWSRNERDQAVLLHPGDALTLDLAKTQPVASKAAPPELAQISLDNVPISVAAARFNRVNSTRLVIADRTIGDTRIVGQFRASDVEQFAKAAAMLVGGKVEHREGVVVIKSKQTQQ